jgi:WD40 repeat protein
LNADEERATFAGITSVAFSPDGKQIVFGSADETLRLWDISPEYWLQTACQQLQHHSILLKPETDIAREAQTICQPIWAKT